LLDLPALLGIEARVVSAREGREPGRTGTAGPAPGVEMARDLLGVLPGAGVDDAGRDRGSARAAEDLAEELLEPLPLPLAPAGLPHRELEVGAAEAGDHLLGVPHLE